MGRRGVESPWKFMRRSSKMATSETRPEFHDPSLRQALQEAAPNIEQFTTRLDRLSSDIKNLESYLERSAVRVPVRVRFALPTSWRHRSDEVEYGEYLAWDKGEPDRYRITYFKVVPGE